jgi:1-deoxy-D-xylulose-5-phosphate synthase
MAFLAYTILMNTEINTPLLDKIDSPADLRKLSESQLDQVADEIREFLLYSVSKSGGHFAASLGATELTIALHYLYNTPDDRLVWDVGHQAYIHKILTGRKERLNTIRQWKGLAPFPKRDESEHDAFGVGHSSTSISAALGMATAASRQGQKRKCVAIIGDGGLTAGMAFEALNHAGAQHSDLLVILNDNNMSISPNVGALSNRFAQLLSGKFYSSVRKSGKKVLSNIPAALEIAKRTEEHIKGLIVPGTLFEEFGFNYIGPVDGHDLSVLISTLKNIQKLEGPQFLHVITKKGKGYTPAEDDPVKYHGVTPFDPKKGIISSNKPSSSLSYSKVFGDWACDMAKLDHRFAAITPAMREGSGLVRFEKEHSDKYFDVAIAEQHSVTVAAGMACDGLKPVVAIYSTFLQRAYDQLIHDVAIQNLPVLFAIDRAGCVGADGPTHNGVYDLTFMRCLPNIVLMTPSDENECRQMLYTGFQLNQPAAVRYPRGTGPGVKVLNEMTQLPIGKGEVRYKGKNIAILAFGTMVESCERIGKELNATVVNMRFVKPIDESLILNICEEHHLIITVEENVIQGGAGSAVNEVLAAYGISQRIVNHGLPDRLIQHGTRDDMLRDAGLDYKGIHNFIMHQISEPKKKKEQIKS